MWYFTRFFLGGFGEAENLVVRAVQTRGNGRTTCFLLFELSTVCMAGFGVGGSRGEGEGSA